jgi:hypothetical protein
MWANDVADRRHFLGASVLRRRGKMTRARPRVTAAAI